ncbi:Microtubule-nucleating Tub4p (gamma-tubulin) complex component [Coemansia sp. RSA 1813]|nr:Microtubule-nucleating Tub4p (gamma-tubulin) complex component [Coemansia sp. RSA 1646]KAJ1768968.1 Microtubule-nucleating Tub4p (gamma-tubulin) complex component [Coemansia sp. RSA 1843]KAJ2088331.1 Microtubule-nucleating Tub4p (gamma-tubulin) complex component [Coemansia sp. RSA 986]KAJ2213330.1 Microtubule-nucleating Tub4p (gamma-tubulin) complex component [Coemansia sp. RSA 487]KAJ2568185.1 Microtubule-nucleating Tub4p (gamma-tubulin) complex component [Coemansia sp. RSA 1813]
MSELEKCLHQYMDAFLGPVHGDAAVGDSGEAEKRSNLSRYFRSIIDSNIAPATSRDESTIVGDLQKKLVASGRDVRSALSVSRLYGLLKQRDPAYSWWPVLYFVAECCTTPSPPASATGMASSSYIAQRTSSPWAGTAAAERMLPPYYQSKQQQQQSAYQRQQRHHPYGAAYPEHSGMHGQRSRSPIRQAVHQNPDSQQQQQQQGVFIHRELPTYDDVSEADLLHDLIFVMQGIDGSHIHWNNRLQAYAVSADIQLSRPTRSMATSLSELGMLTREIQNYITTVDNSGRLFEQSFCTELKAEMSKYYKLVSDIEGRLFKAPHTLQPGESPMGVTLRRLFCWMVEPRQKLRLMVTAIAKVQEGAGGGDVLSIISTLVDDGDPFIQAFAKRLLKTASAPFNDILVRWVTDGELLDPYEEFFIRKRESRRDMFWTEKYTVAPDMIPVHINGEMTRKIFQIGRSLNFLRVACNDSQWVIDGGPRTQLTSDLSDPRNLESFVYRSSSMVNERLMRVLQDTYDLMGHVNAMRQYLLFEQGDFALALMEVLDNQMGSIKSIMAHDLSAVLSSALRSSNTQLEDSEHLSSIVLAFNENNNNSSNEPQRKGWEDVSLAYTLEPPLSHVIPKLAMRQYFEVSRFLLKLKRVEYSLNCVWRQQMTEARSYQRTEELRRRKDGSADAKEPSAGPDDTMQQTMRECAIACSEMIQFFNQVQRYISLNVIEGAWGEFLESTGAAAPKQDAGAGLSGKSTAASREIDIDAWNEAHSKYIAVVHEIVCGSISGLGFQRNLSGIFDTALQFVTAAKELYSDRVLSSRRAATETESQSPAIGALPYRRGGLTEHIQKYRADAKQPQPTDHAGRMRTIVSRFKSQVRGLMRVLSHNTASDLQFLVVTIDFNGVYANSAS